MRISLDITHAPLTMVASVNATQVLNTGRLPELLPDQACDLLPIRSAFGLTHHVADQRPDRTHVPRANLLGRIRIRRDRAVDNLAKAILAGWDRPESFALHDL